METKIRALEEESGRYQEQLLQMSKQLAAQKEEESRLAFALSERKMLLVTNQNALADARERNALLEEDKDEKEKKRLSLKRNWTSAGIFADVGRNTPKPVQFRQRRADEVILPEGERTGPSSGKTKLGTENERVESAGGFAGRVGAEHGGLCP